MRGELEARPWVAGVQWMMAVMVGGGVISPSDVISYVSVIMSHCANSHVNQTKTITTVWIFINFA